MYKYFFKRVLDVLISIIALPFLGLICLVVIPIIKIDDHGPAFYTSDRIGKNCKGFKMIKFRSMKVNAPDIRTKDNETYNSEDDPRLTRVGKILRKLSIDETPQIINVLKGDMSIIGPRPNLNDKPLEKLSEIEIQRLEVRPGITGYNQAYFRNSIPISKKFENDVYYVKNLCFALDLRVLIQTVKVILKRENVYNDESIEASDGSLSSNRSN